MENYRKDIKNVSEVLKNHGETIISTYFEGDSICFRYTGVPLGYDALKEIEALVLSNSNFDEDGFNKFIPFGMNGEYTLTISIPNTKIA